MSVYIEDLRFYCYLPGAFLRQLLTEPAIVDAIVQALDVPGKPAQLKRLAHGEKLKLIEEHAEHLRRLSSSPWRGVDMPEILAAAIRRSGLSDRSVMRVFSAVKKERELAAPVAAWLRGKGLKVYAEVPMGTKRPDVVGHYVSSFFPDYFVAVELKNEIAQMRRGLDQMTTFGEYARYVYLACTPAMAAEYLDSHASMPTVKHWDSRVLETKLRDFGFGLLLVMDKAVHEAITPRSRDPRSEKRREVADALAGRSELLP